MAKLLSAILMILTVAGCDGPRLSETIETNVRERQEFHFRTDMPVPQLEGLQ